MYLNNDQMTLFKEELIRLRTEGKVSDYTFTNIIKWLMEIKRNTISDLNFVYKELSRIECNILKFPHLKGLYDELIVSVKNLEDGKRYCDVLNYIARLDLAMGLKINSRIAFQIDQVYYNVYYLPITNGNFKDPVYIKDSFKKQS